jgi:hypothetical protein
VVSYGGNGEAARLLVSAGVKPSVVGGRAGGLTNTDFPSPRAD